MEFILVLESFSFVRYVPRLFVALGQYIKRWGYPKKKKYSKQKKKREKSRTKYSHYLLKHFTKNTTLSRRAYFFTTGMIKLEDNIVIRLCTSGKCCVFSEKWKTFFCFITYGLKKILTLCTSTH